MSAILAKHVTFTCLVALLGATTLSGQGAAPQPVAAEVPAQLAQLNATLAEIADLLERNLEGQRLGLVMARIQLSSARSARAEEQLLTAKASRADLQERKARMEGQLDSFADRMDARQVDMSAEDIEMMADESARELKMLNSKIKTLDGEIVELENALARYRQELDDWQVLVDRRLSQY